MNESHVDDESSCLSIASEKWAPTVLESDEDDNEQDDSSDGDDLEALRDVALKIDFEGQEALDDDEPSSEMIRVNTNTDLHAFNPIAFFSSKSPDSVSRVHVESSSSSTKSARHVPSPSDSLRVQHGDVWLNQFILPRAHNEVNAKRLESVGKSSSNLTPTRVRENRELATLRTNVENSHFALQSMEDELDVSLLALQAQIPAEEFLKVVQRCLNLRKQAMAACLQASMRAAAQK